MGCVFTSTWQKDTKLEFDDVWLKFKNSELANYERFANNKSKVFEYFYYSTSKIYLMKLKREIAALLSKNKNTDLARPIMKRESEEFVNSIIAESARINEMYGEMIKRLKGVGIVSASRILSENKESGQPWEDVISEVVRTSSVKKGETNVEQKVECKRRHVSSQAKQSVFQEQAKNVEAKSESSYQLPQDVEQLKEAQGPQSAVNAYTPHPDIKQQTESKGLFSTYQQRQEMTEIIKRFKESNEELIKECLSKEQKIKELTAQLAVNKQEMLPKNDNFWQQEAKALKVQLQQYKQQFQRLNYEKEELSLSSKIMEKRYEDLNLRSTILVQAAQKSKAFRIANHIQEIILPPSSQNNPKIIQQSIVAEYTQRKKQGMYKILLRLFPSSQLLPDYRSLQKAVQVRRTILNMFTNKPHHSQLLYHFNRSTSIRYKDYIDNKQNLLFLIRMENEILLGAFAGSYVENNELSQSFIFTISEYREPMKLTQSRRIKRIDQDVSYINFGNGEIRIKVNTLELTSTLASFQSVYNWDNKAVPYERFMGTVERNLTMKAYQIYQMSFKEDQH